MNGTFERGLAFLGAQQDAAGFWSDWDLPVGPSRMWTTAYVGWRLATCRRPTGNMLDRAADWLESSELSGGGWGYAESTGADADSTALGILFLCAMGRPASAAAVRRLLDFHRDDGGFATYGFGQSFGSWTASHAEVTATAALALRTTGVEDGVVERAGEFVRRRRRIDGLWDSYWWTSAFYATDAAVRLLGEEARRDASQTLRGIRPLNCFEASLRSLILREEPIDIVSAQADDGSWPSTPILRLTSRDVSLPHLTEDAGPCFADPRRIFTTATVIHALGHDG